MVDIANIPYEPFACVYTAIGQLCVFSISYRNEEELYEELGKPIDERESTDFIKKFISYVCYPKDSLKDGQNKPDKPLLNDDAILSLTDDDLQTIARIYIENNENLFKKLILKEEENDQGQTVVSYEYGQVEYPKNKNESYTQYLLRLYVEKEKRHKKQKEKMLSGIRSFSSGLEASIKNTLSWGDSLRKTIESIRPVDIANIMSVEAKSPIADILKIEWMKEERRLKPFKELSDRLDQLVGISTKSIEFTIKANEIQTEIAGEIKSSGDVTTKFSKENINLTRIVILLALFGLVASVYTIVRTYNDNNMWRVQNQASVKLLIGKLTEIDKSISKSIDLLKIENEHLREQTAKQANIIEKLNIRIERQGTRLQELEKKLRRKK